MNIYATGEYKTQNDTWHVEDSAWKAEQIYKLLQKNNISAKTYCEIGCGAGEILVQLSQKLPDSSSFFGYDIAPQLKDFWQARAKDNIEFYSRDFLETDSYYDVLMFIDIIEHIEDYLGFLKKIKNKGELKIFNFPLELFAVKALLGHKFLDSRQKYGHLHYFNKDICLAVLQELNFEIIDYFYAPSAIDLAETSKSISFGSKLLKLPRIMLSKLSVDLTAKSLGGYSLFILSR